MPEEELKIPKPELTPNIPDFKNEDEDSEEPKPMTKLEIWKERQRKQAEG